MAPSDSRFLDLGRVPDFVTNVGTLWVLDGVVSHDDVVDFARVMAEFVPRL
ncbi:MAG: hypothetical protein ACJ768_21890 [Gaiellaceae bacterium]